MRSRPVLSSAAAIALLLAGCTSAPDQQAPPDMPLSSGPDLAYPAEVATFRSSLLHDVDVLFLIDNSPSMLPKQQALAASIPTFIAKIEATGLSYQLGVVTSDVGSWTAANKPWSQSLLGCDSFTGDDGLLQRVACTNRGGMSQAAKQACAALCPDPTFVPSGNMGFIRKINGVTNVPRFLQNGVDIGPQKAFQCLALVGEGGCGIEGQLEAAKRALDGHLAGNAGFLRPGSLLVLVLVTDEDDCSVSAAGRGENDPRTMDCATGDPNAAFSCFNPDYRCLARSTVCDQPLNTTGIKTNCKPRPTSYLEPVATYINFFSNLRAADRLLVSGIYTGKALTEGGTFVTTYQSQPNTSYNLNRATGAEAGCVHVQDPSIIGHPQHRLSSFTRHFKDSVEVNVCDTANYPRALDTLFERTQTKFTTKCFSQVPKPVTSNGRSVPDCLVGDVSDQTPNAVPAQPFPVCSAGCCAAWASGGSSGVPTPDDPGIASACGGESAAACYCVEAPQGTAAARGICQSGAVIGVWRKAGPDSAPPDTLVSLRCRTGS